MRWAIAVVVVVVAAVGVTEVASGGWVRRQLREWHEMSYCASSQPGQRPPRKAHEVGHRWSWRLGWPPGRWTCVYHDRRGKVVATRRVP